MDFCRALFPLYLFIYLSIICPSESLNLLGCSLWGYYSWYDKLPVGRGRGLTTLDDFSFNFSRGAVPDPKLLRKPQLALRS